MKRGDRAQLKMEKVLCKTAELDGMTHECTLLQYDEKQECLYVRLETSELTQLSLDAVYSCVIYTEEGGFSCTGRVRERYGSEAGKTAKIHIENGFCKINIKSLTNK